MGFACNSIKHSLFSAQVDALKGKNITRIAAGDGFSVFAR